MTSPPLLKTLVIVSVICAVSIDSWPAWLANAAPPPPAQPAPPGGGPTNEGTGVQSGPASLNVQEPNPVPVSGGSSQSGDSQSDGSSRSGAQLNTEVKRVNSGLGAPNEHLPNLAKILGETQGGLPPSSPEDLDKRFTKDLAKKFLEACKLERKEFTKFKVEHAQLEQSFLKHFGADSVEHQTVGKKVHEYTETYLPLLEKAIEVSERYIKKKGAKSSSGKYAKELWDVYNPLQAHLAQMSLFYLVLLNPSKFVTRLEARLTELNTGRNKKLKKKCHKLSSKVAKYHPAHKKAQKYAQLKPYCDQIQQMTLMSEQLLTSIRQMETVKQRNSESREYLSAMMAVSGHCDQMTSYADSVDEVKMPKGGRKFLGLSGKTWLATAVVGAVSGLAWYNQDMIKYLLGMGDEVRTEPPLVPAPWSEDPFIAGPTPNLDNGPAQPPAQADDPSSFYLILAGSIAGVLLLGIIIVIIYLLVTRRRASGGRQVTNAASDASSTSNASSSSGANNNKWVKDPTRRKHK